MRCLNMRGTLLIIVGLLCGGFAEVQEQGGRAVAQSKTGLAQVTLPRITPVQFSGDQKELKLPGEIIDLIVASGGRYLILRLKNDRQLLVFDTVKGEITQKLLMTADDFLLAASAGHLLVVLPETGKIERWSLTSFKKETEAPLPFSDPVKAISIGFSSEGPLVLLTEDRKYYESCKFMDPLTMQLIELETIYEKVSPDEVKDIRRKIMARRGRIELAPHMYKFIRPSANGRIVVTGSCVIILTDKSIQYRSGRADGFPDAAGNLIYSQRYCRTPLMDEARQFGNTEFQIPAVQPGVFLLLEDNTLDRGASIENISVQLEGDSTFKASLKNVNAKLSNHLPTCKVPVEKLFTFIPDAHLLVQIPNTADKLILHKVDLYTLQNDRKVDYAFVTSTPDPVASPGKPYRYQLKAKLNQRVFYELFQGPADMTVSKSGLISWNVPADFKAVNVPVRINISLASGKVTGYSFLITVPEATGKQDPFDVTAALRKDAADLELKISRSEENYQQMLAKLAENGPKAKQLVEERALGYLRQMEEAEKKKQSTYESRTWKDISGNELDAQLIEVFAGKAKLKSDLTGEYDIPLNELSADDQKYLRDVMAAAREARKKAQDSAPLPDSPQLQMRQIYAGMQNSLQQLRGRFPSARSNARDGEPLLSWRVYLLRYMGGKELYDLFHLNEPWDSEHNQRLIPLMPAFYRTPNSKAGEGKTNLQVITGDHCLFLKKGYVGLTEVTDELGQTAMLVEVPDEMAVIWTKPDDWEFTSESSIKNLFGFHTGGFYALFADGAVKLISSENSLKEISRAFIRDDGEKLNLK